MVKRIVAVGGANERTELQKTLVEFGNDYALNIYETCLVDVNTPNVLINANIAMPDFGRNLNSPKKWRNARYSDGKKKPDRNAKCVCGSGKKSKNCCK